MSTVSVVSLAEWFCNWRSDVHFPANEAVVEVIRHTSDLSKAETPVYDTMANLPAGFNAQYNVVANNKRYEFFNDAVANAISHVWHTSVGRHHHTTAQHDGMSSNR